MKLFEFKIGVPYENGWHIFWLILNPVFQIRWFTDCGYWFIYLHLWKHYIRFSNAGFTKGRFK
jgi:hypothetical protein